MVMISNEKVVYLWNDYCEGKDNFTEMVYPNNDDAFNTFGFTINSTLISVKNGTYEWDDEWITSDDYGNPVSSNDPKKLMDKDILNNLLKDL
jgi:hypothetical protein